MQGLNETTHDHQQMNCSYQELSASEDNFKLITYCFLLLGSLFGNIFIIIIVYKNQDLHKTVNYFIVNMAVSDLVFPLVWLPVEIVAKANNSTWWRWYLSGTFGSITCKFIIFVSQVSFLVSSQSFVWIAIDRFFAVVFPVRLGFISKKIRMIAIASTWSLAAAFCFIYLISLDLRKEGNYACRKHTMFVPINQKDFAIYLWFQTTLLYFVPLFISTLLYATITAALHKQSKSLANSGPRIQRNVFEKRKRAIRLSVVTMVTYFLSVSPAMLVRLHFSRVLPLSCTMIEVLRVTADVCHYASTVINPVICLSFVQSYRRGLRNILCCCLRKQRDETAQQGQIAQKEIITPSGEKYRNRRNCKVSANNEETLDTTL